MTGGKQNAPHSALTKQISQSERFNGDEDLLEHISGLATVTMVTFLGFTPITCVSVTLLSL